MLVDLLYELDMTGASPQDSKFSGTNGILATFGGRILDLPRGTIKFTGVLNIPAGTIIRGTGTSFDEVNGSIINGTALKFSSSAAAAKFLTLANDVVLENMVIQYDKTTLPNAAGTGGYLLYANGASRIRLRNCRIVGAAMNQNMPSANVGSHSCVGLENCTDCIVEGCDIAWSLGVEGVGLDITGGSNNVVNNTRVRNNSGSGLTVRGNVVAGIPRRCVFQDCEITDNGQIAILGQSTTVNKVVNTAPAVPDAISGTRYILDYTGTYPLPTSLAIGSTVSLSKATARTVTLQAVSGFQGVISGTSYSWQPNDKRVFLLTVMPNNTWQVSLAGQGADIQGVGHVLTDSVSKGNGGNGFQVKTDNFAKVWQSGSYALNALVSHQNKTYKCTAPTSTTPPGTGWVEFYPTTTSDISFVGCRADGSVAGNGFYIDNWAGTTAVPVMPPPQNVSLSNCSSVVNYLNGVDVGVSNTVLNVDMVNCVSRSNGSDGVVIHRNSVNTKLANCELNGNGKLVAGSWNCRIIAATGVRFANCSLQGVDPVDQNLTSISAIGLTANARCLGLQVIKTASGSTLADVVISGLRCKNHVVTDSFLGGVNVAYYLDATSSGSFSTVAGLVTLEQESVGLVAHLLATTAISARSRVKLNSSGGIAIAQSTDMAIGETLVASTGASTETVDVKIVGVRQGLAGSNVMAIGDHVFPSSTAGMWTNSGTGPVGQVIVPTPDSSPFTFVYITYI